LGSSPCIQQTAEFRISNRRISKRGFALLSPLNKIGNLLFDIRFLYLYATEEGRCLFFDQTGLPPEAGKLFRPEAVLNPQTLKPDCRMSIINIKHEVSDPAFYGPLISDQEKKAQRNPNNAKEWLEPGRLCEARLEMINVFAKRQFFIRWLPPLAFLCFFALIAVLYFNAPPLHPGIVAAAVSICALGLVFIRFVRYPRSGIKYFRKAIAHHSPMNKEEYENLRGLVFAGEEALLPVVATL
jgi:hypothetical protein